MKNLTIANQLTILRIVLIPAFVLLVVYDRLGSALLVFVTAGLTDALCAATTEGLREHTWVIVEGHSPKNWGVGGVPWPTEKTPD